MELEIMRLFPFKLSHKYDEDLNESAEFLHSNLHLGKNNMYIYILLSKYS
jgi:hypothetical protein